MVRKRVVTIDGNDAQEIWKNFQACRSLLPASDELYSIDWTTWQEHPPIWKTACNLLTTMRHIAYGFEECYEDGFLSPLEQRLRRCPDCFVVSSDPDQRMILNLNLARGPKQIDFGPIIGFSSVNPLSEKGYERYLNREFSLLSVPANAIVRSHYKPHSIKHLFITGCVCLPELRQPFTNSRRRPRERQGPKVLRDLAEQIGMMLPRMTWDEALDRPRLIDNTDSVFPKLMCPLSKRYTGWPMAKRMGFSSSSAHTPPFIDNDGFELFTLDLINAYKLAPRRRRTLRHFIKFLYQGPKRWR